MMCKMGKFQGLGISENNVFWKSAVLYLCWVYTVWTLLLETTDSKVFTCLYLTSNSHYISYYFTTA